MQFINAYADSQRAEAYANLEFPGTYYLAYRDVPQIIAEHITGRKALDFGCGTGRSTRFLKSLGFDAIGVDIAQDMLKQAHARDPQGDYRLIEDDDLNELHDQVYDLVFAAFTFDNIPTREKRVTICKELRDLLGSEGRMVILASAAEIYTHEWASFRTRDFPENRVASSGDRVRIIITDVADHRPVEDIFWTDEAYQEVYKQAGLEVVEMYQPLAKESEPYAWVSETRISPWAIYVLKKAAGAV